MNRRWVLDRFDDDSPPCAADGDPGEARTGAAVEAADAGEGTIEDAPRPPAETPEVPESAAEEPADLAAGPAEDSLPAPDTVPAADDETASAPSAVGTGCAGAAVACAAEAGEAGAELAERLDAAAARLCALGEAMVQRRRDAHLAAARAFGEAAQRCLPTLTGAGFAAEIAAAAFAVARTEGFGELQLRLPPELVDGVADALERHGPNTGFRIEGDSALAPHEAEIAWRDGGAQLDAERLSAAALETLRQTLSNETLLKPQSKDHPQ